MSFGDRLREERQRRLLSQEELAEALGVSRRTITRWEQNLALPRSFAQQQLSQFFGLSSQEFLKELETQTPPTLLWTVPYPRNPFFIGREEILHTLHCRLTARQSAAPQEALALCGLGGIGKTQVAIEYAHRYASEYRAVFWLAAENIESLMRSVQQIAEQLHLPERLAAKQVQMVMAMQHWLAIHPDWLLIADNVEDLDLLQTVLPSQRPGAILLTTRHQALGLLAEAVELPPMSQQEGVSLLLARARLSGETAPDAAHPGASPHETPATTGAAELITLLEGLPLAVDQAGAYIEETGCRVIDYLERYHSQRKHILARRGMQGGAHPASVSTTLRLSVERIARQHPAAGELLHLCALLHPEAIPEELFSAGASHLGSTLGSLVADPYQFDLTLALLRSASLVTRSPQTKTLSLHRLVQAVLADQMEPAEMRTWSERIVRMVNAAFPEDALDTWEQCERYLPQALACISPLASAEDTLPEMGELLCKVGSYLMVRGRYKEAEELLEQAVKLGERQHSTNYIVMLSRLEKRAELFWRQGEYRHAEALLQYLLRIEEQHLGPTHPRVADALNGLTTVYWSLGKYAEAEQLGLRSLSIREQQLGAEHPETGLTLLNLVVVYRDQGRTGEAQQLGLRALGIYERQLRAEHPYTALTLNNLASVYRLQGQYEEAEQLHLRALGISKRQLGAEHPYTGRALHGLASVYRAQRQCEEAERLYQQELAINEPHLGPTHPWTAEVLNALANVHQDQGRYEEAEPLYRRALDIFEQQLGPNHPHTAFTLHDLANMYRDRGRYKQAEPLYQRALAICEQRLGPDHTRTMKIRNDRAVEKSLKG